MINEISICFWFDGNAEQAIKFYAGVFEDAAIHSSTPMVSSFSLAGRKFMALNGGPQFTINSSISFFVHCDTEDEIETKWNLLSEKGKTLMPLSKYPWSEKYGWCQDQFGVNWQLMMGEKTKEIIFPSLMFVDGNNGKLAEAIEFYTSLFKNSSTILISKYEKGEPDVEGNIKHAQFLLNNQLFAAMESSANFNFNFNEAISLVVTCETQDEIDFYWEQLTSNGGKEGRCGWLKDKYGVSWQIVPSILGKLMNNAAHASKVMEAFMQMNKFDIATLENAAG